MLQEGMALANLLCKLLDLFTAEAVAGAADGSVSGLATVLLDAASKPRGTQAATIRAAALAKLNPELYMQLSDSGRLHTLQVLPPLHSSSALIVSCTVPWL